MSIVQQLYRQKKKKPQFQVLWYFSPGSSSLLLYFANACSSDSLLYPQHAECQYTQAVSCFAVCVSTLLHLTFIFSSPPIFNLIYPSITVCLPHTFSLL